MQRAELLEKVIHSGIVAVVRAANTEEAIKLVDSIVAGGIKSIELTYSVPQANEVIAKLAQKYAETDVIIGAGTVLDTVSARLAILAGAQFIVSPCFSSDVAKMCNLYQIPYVPGILTPREAQIALEYGSELIKLFPGDIAGAKMIKDLKGPFPYLNILPSGGVSTNNVGQWLEAGAVAVSAGSSLTSPAKQGDFAKITANAKEFVQAFERAKG